MKTDNPHPLHPKSHLFTLRLWLEALDPGQGEVRMQVKHVLSGETRYFRDWGRLSAYLLAVVQGDEHGNDEIEGDSP